MIQARIEAERCYFCFDAPCTQICPTSINVPQFIQRIAQGNVRGAAETILEANPLGGMCSRVCPTENLCEKDCVRNTNEAKPVEIGLLQRFATDAHFADPGEPLFVRAAPTGRRIAVVGAGPAGLAAAHRLALLGHDVVLFEARAKLGGLNEYGLASYKTTGGFAQQEVELAAFDRRYRSAHGASARARHHAQRAGRGIRRRLPRARAGRRQCLGDN
ncbi:MAG: FAD-dependent oxidoreductase [Propionivibrio sp.]